jgi:hypothetical protein
MHHDPFQGGAIRAQLRRALARGLTPGDHAVSAVRNQRAASAPDAAANAASTAGEPVVGQAALVDDELRGRGVGDLRGACRRHPPALGQCRERTDLVPVGLAGPLVGRALTERHDLGFEATLGLRRDGPPVRLDREGLHVVAGDVPLVCDHLGRAELAHLLRAVAGDPAVRPGERVVEAQRMPRSHRRRDGDLRPLLNSAGDDHVHGPRQHGLGGEVDRLLRRPALAVDGGAGYVLG